MNKYLIVSIFLLAIISLGVVSATEGASDDNLSVDTDNELSIDEINADGGNAISSNEDATLSSENSETLNDPVTPTYVLDIQPNVTNTASAYIVQYGQKISVKGTFINATGNVTVSFGYSSNYEDHTIQLVNGSFSQDFTKYAVKSNQYIKVVYNGDDNYKKTSIQKTVHVYNENFAVATGANYGQKAFITVTLYNATGNVNFTINGRNYTGKLENGTYIQEFTNYTLGKNTVTVAYEGDENYNAYSKSESFTVDLNANTPTIYNLQTETIKIYLGDATGIVNLTFNNKTTQLSIVNGVVSLDITNYTIGNNTVGVEYFGDSTFAPFSKNITFEVLDKENATILTSVHQKNGSNFIAICIPYGTGSVNVSINGKKQVLELVNGQILYPIGENDVIKSIKVTYDGNTRLNAGKSAKFINLDYIVNEDTWMYYFDQTNSGKFFDFIPAGITLDFQGSIINPDSSNIMGIEINKPVNIISTTEDAYIDLNTIAGSLLGENPGNSFAVTRGGSGSNITGIDFHNTQLWIFNTTNVVLDRISNVIENQRVGSGNGATSVRANSTYVTIKNSYFYTENNGGSSSLVMAWADHCTFDNNTVRAEGNVGNLIYLTTYNVDIPEGVTANVYNKIINNKIYGKSGSSISAGLFLSGAHNLVENNTLYKASMGIQWGTTALPDTIYRGNKLLEGAGLSSVPMATIYNNEITGTLSTNTNSTVYNNIVGKAVTVGAGSLVYNNTVGGFTMNGANSVVHDNTVNGATTISQVNVKAYNNVFNGAVTISQANGQIYNNTFNGDNSIKFSSANSKNITFANNYVLGNIEYGAVAVNNTIVNNTIITSKDYTIDLKSYNNTYTTIVDNNLISNNKTGNASINHIDDATLTIDNFDAKGVEITVSAENITVGQKALINITANETAMNKVTVTVNGKKYDVTLTNAKGSLEVSDLLAGSYTVSVKSDDKTFFGLNSTEFSVTKNNASAFVINMPVVVQGVNSTFTVSIADATGNVTAEIDFEEYTSALVNGVATFNVPNLHTGEYSVDITYSGDYKYFSNSTSATLNVTASKKVRIYLYDNEFYQKVSGVWIYFENFDGEYIKDADVTVTCNNYIYELITDENGEVYVNLDLTRGKYPMNIVFEGDGNYEKTTYNTTITVEDYTMMNVVLLNGNIFGILVDGSGNPVSNAQIIYTIDNGSNITLNTNADGSFTITPTVNGVYRINFVGDNITGSSNATITISHIVPVPPAPPVVVKKQTTVKSAAKTFKAKKSKVVSVTLKSGATKIKGKIVTLKIKGKTYKAKTNAKGIAKIKIKLTKKGKYTGVLNFAGDNTYLASTSTVKITIK